MIVLLGSPWQLLPWTAPHHCLAAVAQATHGLSWLLQLWGTQGLGVGDSGWQATVSQVAVLGLEGDDVPPPQGSGQNL